MKIEKCGYCNCENNDKKHKLKHKEYGYICLNCYENLY